MADKATPQPPLDGTLLEEPLEGTPPRESEEEGSDPRLDAIADQVGKGAYGEAARGAEVLLREGVRDVRLISPYLFGLFHEEGLKGMPGIFRSLLTTLTESWEAFGPPEKKAVLTDNGLRWLLKTVNKHLLHHEKLKDERWRGWCEPDNRAPLEEALPLTEPLLAAFEAALPGNGCEKPLRSLVSWLGDHLRALPAESPPPEEAPPVAAVEEHEVQEEKGQVLSTPQAPEPGLPISPAMALLLRKLAAFDVLLARQDFLKAGVVAADVLTTVERFDPRIYLPAIFSRFFAGLSTNAETIEPLLHNTESLAFRSLDQLYRVDLDAFLAQDANQEE